MCEKRRDLVWLILIIPGLLLAQAQQSFHTSFWENQAHYDQKNSLIEVALKSPAFYGFDQKTQSRIVFHRFCEHEKRCKLLRFQYYYDQDHVSTLTIELKSSDGDVQWKRSTTFHDHDTKGAARSWPLRSVESLYDGSVKRSYYRWTLGYGAYVKREKYQMAVSGFEQKDVISFALQERLKWESAVKQYGNALHTIYDNNSLRRDDDGTIRLLGEPLDDGLYRFIGMDVEVIATVIESRIEGAIRGYSSAGALVAEGFFRHGKEEGRQTEYFANGNKKHVAFFHKGKKEGQSCDYYEAGIKASCEMYSEGQRDGIARFYYKDGTRKEMTTYKKGYRHGWSMHYYPAGQLKYRGLFLRGLLQGKQTFYEQDGTIANEVLYKDGVIQQPGFVEK